MESHDYIDGRLVRRQTVPPPPQEQPVYLNTDTGRYIQHGTRTYHRLVESDYEVVEDYYLVHSEEEELIEEIINETRYNEENLDGQRLTFNNIQQIRAAIQADQDEYDDFILQQIRLTGHLPPVLPVVHELWRTMPRDLQSLILSCVGNVSCL
ncbi:hypothetical protein RIR_jg39840.t1 [Rhizophagus irregularis DAOM 181602=DAOM 197198]|nr:hypothetical protein RIR_jg39840.t1 [Rhizophagus irregularis DAOM 181602=DAOM 197198]